MASAKIGISGWTYAPWRGVFYPPGLKHAEELAFASHKFATIELNGSFYSLQTPASYQRWYRATPEDFVFALKGGRFITHLKRLKDVEGGLANFFASGPLCLGEKLGPILWQLPPTFRFDESRLAAFFELLPRDAAAAARLARRHEPRLAKRAFTEAISDEPLRHALEVRHPSFEDPRFLELLSRHSIAACVADSAGLYPMLDAVTADFVYVRLHGSKRLYTSGYTPRELRQWAARIERWLAGGTPVYVYFDNDVKVRAPFDAENLARLLRGERPRPTPRATRQVSEEPRTNWAAWRK